MRKRLDERHVRSETRTRDTKPVLDEVKRAGKNTDRVLGVEVRSITPPRAILTTHI